MKHFKVTIVAELNFKDFPDEIQKEFISLLTELKTKKGKRSSFDVEEVET